MKVKTTKVLYCDKLLAIAAQHSLEPNNNYNDSLEQPRLVCTLKL